MAKTSASAFHVTRVSPSMGGPLTQDDERAAAADVVVIGDDVWRRRFGAEPAILGRVIQARSRQHTLVGVMPPGFRAPLADSFWIPLRPAPSYEPLAGLPVTVFGRLAPDASLEAAQAEVEAIGVRLSASSPATHQLRFRVMPYTHFFTEADALERAGDAPHSIRGRSSPCHRLRQRRDSRLRAHGDP